MSQSATEGQAFVALESLRSALPTAYEPWLDALTDLGLLPRYGPSEDLILTSDARHAESILRVVASDEDPRLDPTGLFWPGWPQHVPLGLGTSLEVQADLRSFPAALHGALVTLTREAEVDAPLEIEKVVSPFFGPAMFASRSRQKCSQAQDLVELDRAVTDIAASHFAGSAHYMGSKRQLAGFLATTLVGVVPSGATVIDLMCGSGAASAAFCRRWPTIAADAEAFAVHLAKVQGGGMTPDRAASIIEKMVPEARLNTERLRPELAQLLEIEEELLQGEAGTRDKQKITRFLRETPTFPDGEAAHGWDPVAEVRRRQLGDSDLPWCLFTAYFANVYFGLRQCVEIDSLRYAISTLADKDDRAWALGALISTVSSVAATYGGHFAQPLSVAPDEMTDEQTAALLDKHSQGVFFEFTVRLRALAVESQNAAHQVETIHCAWPDVMADLGQRFGPDEAFIYLDAPYKREEYSRYYHVLDTLVAYDYPMSAGKGRMPDKKSGRRFASQFATRDRDLLEDTFTSLLAGILDRGWPCAWSYSDNAAGSIVRILDRVKGSLPCEISSVSTPYKHKRQGGHTTKGDSGGHVTEYLIILQPKQADRF